MPAPTNEVRTGKVFRPAPSLRLPVIAHQIEKKSSSTDFQWPWKGMNCGVIFSRGVGSVAGEAKGRRAYRKLYHSEVCDVHEVFAVVIPSNDKRRFFDGADIVVFCAAYLMSRSESSLITRCDTLQTAVRRAAISSRLGAGSVDHRLLGKQFAGVFNRVGLWGAYPGFFLKIVV